MNALTCFWRFIGVCKNCTCDYDKTHHPNNKDCPRYREFELTIYEVKEVKNEGDESPSQKDEE